MTIQRSQKKGHCTCVLKMGRYSGSWYLEMLLLRWLFSMLTNMMEMIRVFSDSYSYWSLIFWLKFRVSAVRIIENSSLSWCCYFLSLMSFSFWFYYASLYRRYECVYIWICQSPSLRDCFEDWGSYPAARDLISILSVFWYFPVTWLFILNSRICSQDMLVDGWPGYLVQCS